MQNSRIPERKMNPFPLSAMAAGRIPMLFLLLVSFAVHPFSASGAVRFFDLEKPEHAAIINQNRNAVLTRDFEQVPVLTVTLPPGTGSGGKITFPLPMEELRGKQLFFEADVMFRNISRPVRRYHGVKFMAHVKGRNGETWPQHWFARKESSGNSIRESPTLCSYDLLNEPHSRYLNYGTPACPAILEKAIEMIRAVDPSTPVIVEADFMASPEKLEYLPVYPQTDILYSVHFYFPGALTHQLELKKKPFLRYPSGEWNKQAFTGQLRQIGIVWGQYFNENEDCLHPALNGIGGAAWHLTILGTKPATASTISKTLLNLNLLICPGMSKPPKSKNLDFRYVNNPHYGVNILLQRCKTPKEWSASTDMYVSGRITKLSLPSRKILIADTWTQKTTTVGDINPEPGRYMFNAKEYQNDGGITAARHEKSVNLLYLDGHTGSIRVPNPLDPINSAPALKCGK